MADDVRLVDACPACHKMLSFLLLDCLSLMPLWICCLCWWGTEKTKNRKKKRRKAKAKLKRNQSHQHPRTQLVGCHCSLSAWKWERREQTATASCPKTLPLLFSLAFLPQSLKEGHATSVDSHVILVRRNTHAAHKAHRFPRQAGGNAKGNNNNLQQQQQQQPELATRAQLICPAVAAVIARRSPPSFMQIFHLRV